MKESHRVYRTQSSKLCASLRRKRGKRDPERLVKQIMTENFPKLGKQIDTRIQAAQRISNRLNTKRSSEKHIIIKLSKGKGREGTLKTLREK